MYLFCFIVHIDLSFQFVCCFCCSAAFLKGLGVCPKEQGRPALEGTCYTSSLLDKELPEIILLSSFVSPVTVVTMVTVF